MTPNAEPNLLASSPRTSQLRNLAGTARAPHIHTNTLLKRIERIGDLLGKDWQLLDTP
ncbi:helix-turn-helix domain-containing protein [Streptomyces sp. NBC_01352]|uniref:helix-turn-helix domain-containing protein n=1 Tax=Streptomyces sp. NBC_01352 TaxID=2903834 RepID=UPI002E3106BA|nr:helix-turn-helix domain-containing protein [Streptomyces sp. NBC_01352]